MSKFNLPLIGTFTWPTPPGPYRATTCWGRKLNYGSHTVHTFLTTQGHGGAGATSETAQTWKTVHTKHTLSHPNKANMNDDYDGQVIFGDLVGLKLPDILSYRWGKTLKKTHPGNLSRQGIEPGPAAWQAHILPPAPQWWTLEAFIGDFETLILKVLYIRGHIDDNFWDKNLCHSRIRTPDLQLSVLAP